MPVKKVYPYIAKHTVEDLYVKFTGDGTGVVLCSTLPEYKEGYVSNEWVQGLFRKVSKCNL